MKVRDPLVLLVLIAAALWLLVAIWIIGPAV